MSKYSRSKAGFTLIEIMIVVLIIGILLAIAVPNFMTARANSRAKACQANLKQIQAAKEQWAMKTNAAEDAAPDMAALVPVYMKKEPLCPDGNLAYTVGAMDTDPSCANSAKEGHNIDGTAAPTP